MTRDADYCAGFGAFARGLPVSDNPHPGGSEAHEDWRDGWRDAAEELSGDHGEGDFEDENEDADHA